MKETMRKFLSLIIIATSFFTFSESYAQRVQQVKVKKGDLKAIKAAKKEAKKLSKLGWKVTEGSLPMEKSLEKSWAMQLDVDDNGYKKFINADGNGVAETKSAADMQALELAKLAIAGQLQTEIAAIIESSIANEQLTREEAASITKVVGGAKNIIATSLSNVDPVFKIYRDVKKKNVEVQLKLFYGYEMALTSAKTTLKKQLAEETKIVHEKLDKILKLD